ncbi:MAG: PhoPQ-activated protein PqaA family protein [Mariniphaga sp.]
MRKVLLGVFVLLCSLTTALSNPPKQITPETALQAYLHNSDKSFKWEVNDKKNINGVTIYRIIFQSQKWRNINWNHEMFIMVPDLLKYNDALLFITGGSLKNEKPNTHEWTEGLTKSLSLLAKTNMAIVALLWQVPNQPLYDDLEEDALISYTLHNYQNDHDFTWPLLFPMTKSAVRAMDVVQLFAKKEIQRKVDKFVVSGASKRGWTTWLTGANDKRVKAICPMVIDMLNMPVNIPYHKVVWGDYSIEIEDYVKLGLAQQFGDTKSNDLVQMIDPYSYRKTLTMPKMIFMGTNDPYWPVDAVKNYIDNMPGDNHICYTPNAAHDLGDKKKALTTLSAFLGTTITNGKYPICKSSISEQNGIITLKVQATPELLQNAILWYADSNDQDFRDEHWSNIELNPANKSEVTVEVKTPKSGFKAFYVDLKYRAVYGDDYTQSTRMFVTNDKNLLLKSN